MMSHLRNTVSRVSSGEYAASSYTAEEYHWIHDVVEGSDGEAIALLETSLAESCDQFPDDTSTLLA
jgi:hypothetical protein